MTRRLFGTLDLELMEELMACQPDSPFFVKDEGLRYVAANPAMARLCGVKGPAELYGKTAHDLFARPLANRYDMYDRRVLTMRRSMTNVLDFSAAPGRASWLLFTRSPVIAADGTVIGVAANARRIAGRGAADPALQTLTRIVARLRAEFDQPLRLDQLASESNVSRSQLERDFRRVFAMSLRDFLSRTRMEQALELLDRGTSVASIAYACGYSDHSSFTRTFRKVFGIAPSAWQARQVQSAI
ncbi:helix-turn-helix domain-containing protein [Novosphingobium sp.]|uniref:helix-turn-helix domain-containing protein n=1 Tax=Novosphingobium sp. TaxID=1874826 RepID=UPI0038B87616